MPSGWSGYPTGKIPLSMLTEIRSDIGASGYGQPDAARAYYAIAAAFRARFGYELKFSEFYRTWDRQNYYYQGYLKRLAGVPGYEGFNPAAPPDRGKHEEALAIDFAWPLTSWTTPEQAWFQANEARFGFSSAQGKADGEPWHKVYIGSTTTPAGGGSTPITNRTDDDEMLSAEAQKWMTSTFATKEDVRRENRGRLYYCPTPHPGLPQFVVIFINRDPGAGNVLYCNGGEPQAINWQKLYGQTGDTVEQAKAYPDTADQYTTRINLALGIDSAFTNNAAKK